MKLRPVMNLDGPSRVRIWSAAAWMVLVMLVSSANAQDFTSFLSEVNAAAPADRASMVSSFVDSNPTSPLFESDTVAVFYFYGAASGVSIAGDFNNWNGSLMPFSKIESTNFWYRSLSFEPTARLDYKLVKNGSDWILDPRNSARVSGGFGPNSEVAMPQYVQPSEIVAESSVPKGNLVSTSFQSSTMNASFALTVYTPPSYDASSSTLYPSILYHDGSEYVQLANVPTVLDNLIDQGKIEPIVAFFLKPNNREAEYATTKTELFTSMVVQEIMPWARSEYKISPNPQRTAVTGASYGGLISTQQCHRNPTVFGLCAPFSPSYWVGNGALMNEVESDAPSGVKYYLDWGTYEGSISTTGPAFLNILQAKGNLVAHNVWHEGHSWGSWRAHQDNMLIYFFPGSNATSRSDLSTPGPVRLGANYPNPFRERTTISFETDSSGPVSIAVFDSLGRQVDVLLNELVPLGQHTVDFNASENPSGLYLVKLSANGLQQTRSITLVR